MEVQALSHIQHNNNEYNEGDVFEVNDEHGNTLINAGVVIEIASTEDHPAIVEDEEGSQGIDITKLNRKELESFAVDNELMEADEVAEYKNKKELLAAVEEALNHEEEEE